MLTVRSLTKRTVHRTLITSQRDTGRLRVEFRKDLTNASVTSRDIQRRTGLHMFLTCEVSGRFTQVQFLLRPLLVKICFA